METILKESVYEKADCPICRGASKIITQCQTIDPDSDLVLNLRECKTCKHWWNEPFTTQETLNSLYANSSPFVVPHYYQKNMLADKHNNLLEKRIYDALLPHSLKMSGAQNFNYFELGIGSGNLFQYFRNKANISYGVEPGNWVIHKDKFIVSDISNVPAEVRFDVLIANDVLEHVVSPIQMVTAFNKLANKDGIIHCTFPNKDSFKAQLMKSKWDMVRPYGHLHYFSANSIKRLFEQSGFEIVKMRSMRAGQVTSLGIIKNFDYKMKNLPYRLIKSLLLGQLLLGKDQWQVIARKK